ncbi:MAG: hypothetical protein CK552_06425 [Actinobacteria bacterium]|nr:MAG: hypothetical protein CK552_06425 [Actinomycetota bacterium]
MMKDPRRPIFGFLWPPKENAVDGDFKQIRLIRIPARGPWRLILLVGASILIVMFAGVAIMAVSSTSVFPVLITGAVLASTVVILLRGWSIGTYVNDDAVVVRRMFSSAACPWSSVARIECSGQAVVLYLVDGSMIVTGIAMNSLDTWLRPSAHDAAVIAFENWARKN